ncbi:unnamed protein product [Rhizoctonia solani]|uniref:Uncharacterized protein n=1 Tax=Rhizoctonia solani TaxID=456999 RepID=A0A8H3E744_9AGAM|nr:unnamed protein product [Rhizoctonia solani]
MQPKLIGALIVLFGLSAASPTGRERAALEPDRSLPRDLVARNPESATVEPPPWRRGPTPAGPFQPLPPPTPVP